MDENSAKLSLDDLVSRCTFPAEFVGDWPRYLVSRFRGGNRTAEEVIVLAEEYAASVVARRDSDPSADDPTWLFAEAARVEETYKQIAAEIEDAAARQAAMDQAARGRAHRERKATERPTRRIKQHLETYPEPS